MIQQSHSLVFMSPYWRSCSKGVQEHGVVVGRGRGGKGQIFLMGELTGKIDGGRGWPKSPCITQLGFQPGTLLKRKLLVIKTQK